MSSTIGNIGSYDPTALYESLFKKIDSNSDGGIDKTEFTSALSDMAGDQNVSEDEEAKMFAALDTDNNGTIDTKEMMKALKDAGEQARTAMPPPPPNGNGPDFTKMAQDLLKSIDTSGDGSIDKSEFTAALSANQSSDSTDTDTLFSKLDADSDGKVSESELTDSLKNMRPPMPPPPQDASTGSDVSASTSGVDDSSTTTGLDKLLADLVSSLNSTNDTTSSTDDTDSVSGQNSLFSDLVTSLKSSSKAESDLFSQLIESLKSSTTSSDDQITSIFNSLIQEMQNSAQYSQTGNVSYTTGNLSSLLSEYA